MRLARNAFFLGLPVLLACKRRPDPIPVRGEDAAVGASAAASGGAAVGEAPTFRLVGRFDGHRYAWSGSTIAARFTGPSLALRIRVKPGDPTTPYLVRLDERPDRTIDISSDRERYELAADLDPARPHEVRIVREAEAFAGVHELLGLELAAAPAGAFLPDKPRRFRLEIIGDSITCGYGNLGNVGTTGCRFSFVTERASQAYGALLGNALDADVTTVAWSGKGIFRNYDGTTTETMPVLFERTLPESPSVPWAFAAHPAADLVIIALGTNDVSGGAGRPLDLGAFEDAYVALAQRVRAVYPSAFLFFTTSPMVHHATVPSVPGDVAIVLRTRLEHVVTRRIADGDARVELVVLPDEAPHWGCDGHPDAALNARMAEVLLPRLRSRLPP